MGMSWIILKISNNFLNKKYWHISISIKFKDISKIFGYSNKFLKIKKNREK